MKKGRGRGEERRAEGDRHVGLTTKGAALPLLLPQNPDFFFFFFFAAEAFARIQLNTALPRWTFPPSDRLQHGMREGGLTPRRLGRGLEYLEERKRKEKIHSAAEAKESDSGKMSVPVSMSAPRLFNDFTVLAVPQIQNKTKHAEGS